MKNLYRAVNEDENRVEIYLSSFYEDACASWIYTHQLHCKTAKKVMNELICDCGVYTMTKQEILK